MPADDCGGVRFPANGRHGGWRKGVLARFDAVAVGGWRRDNKEGDVVGGVVLDAVSEFGRDFQAVLAAENVGLAVDLNGERAGENEKELAGAGMVMRDFGRARRHAFLNHTEIVAAD